MVSFVRLLVLVISSVSAVRLTVRDIADSSNAVADFKHCQKSCTPITTLAGECASESCICPTILSKGPSCVSCLGTKNATLAEEINESFQECIVNEIPTALTASDKCASSCNSLFKKLAACKLSDTCVCSTLEKDDTCYKCLLKNDPKTASTVDIKALSKSCSLPYPSAHNFPHECDYSCLNVYLALDTCLPTDYDCLCSSGTSTRRIAKKAYEYSAFQWGSAACSKCVKQYSKSLANEITAVQKVCGPAVKLVTPPITAKVTTTVKETPTTKTSTVKASTSLTKKTTATSTKKVTTTSTKKTTATSTKKATATNTEKTTATSTKKTTDTSTKKATASSTASGKTLYPRLIVPVQESNPKKSYGTQYITTVDKTQEVVVVFDIPYGTKYDCDLTFHLPGTGASPGSGTSAYTLSGSSLAAYQLTSEIKSSLTYSALPGVSKTLGNFALKEGSTSSLKISPTCNPGTAISIKLVSVGGTSLKWFEDYNAPAVGIVLNLH